MSGKTSLPPEVISKMKIRWDSGDSVEDIAQEFSVHPNTVRNQSKSNDWKPRGSRREQYIERVNETSKTVVIADKVERLSLIHI